MKDEIKETSGAAEPEASAETAEKTMPARRKTEPPKVEPAPKPDPAPADELRPVEDLAEEAGIPAWELAGLRRAAGWAKGKQVTKTDLDAALSAFRSRGQGGGKIAVKG